MVASSSQLAAAWQSVPDCSQLQSPRMVPGGSPFSPRIQSLPPPIRASSPTQRLLDPLGDISPTRAPFADGWGTLAYISSWNGVVATPPHVTPRSRRATLAATPKSGYRPPTSPLPHTSGPSHVQPLHLQPLHRPSTGEPILQMQAFVDGTSVPAPQSRRAHPTAPKPTARRVDIQSSSMPYDGEHCGLEKAFVGNNRVSVVAWRNSTADSYMRRGGRPRSHAAARAMTPLTPRTLTKADKVEAAAAGTLNGSGLQGSSTAAPPLPPLAAFPQESIWRSTRPVQHYTPYPDLVDKADVKLA